MSLKITTNPYIYRMNEDGEFVCTHNQASVVKRCCTSRGESGYIECDCGGMDMVICPNYECTGITEDEANELLGGNQ